MFGLKFFVRVQTFRRVPPWSIYNDDESTLGSAVHNERELSPIGHTHARIVAAGQAQ